MKKKPKIVRGFSSLLLLILLVVSVFNATLPTANAATTTKTEKKYEIAVVFDNSGSMYEDKAWCRAKYAMEIFASMLNYDNGDKLRIYPMWQVTTNGKTPKSGGSYSAIEINRKDDIDKISNLFTVSPSGTPFEPALEAFDYLKSVKDREKWLLVLTDGAFNKMQRTGASRNMSSKELRSELLKLATNDISVQYLGFGEATKLKADESKNFYSKKSSDTSLKDDIIEICNAIFQRSVLPGNRLSGTTLNLDLSMKNLIVFAQGSDAKITSLTDESGKEIAATLNSGQRKYSTIKANGYENAKVDKTLAGQVVTFAGCPKGKYTLKYSDTDKIQIFYEPDVDIKVTLKNDDGETLDESSDNLAPGTYKVTSAIVDGKTGKDVTSHELMGKDVKLVTKVKTSKGKEYKQYANGSQIKFEEDPETEIVIEGEYLGKYKITSRDDSSLAWLSNLEFTKPAVAFKLDVKAKQTWYAMKEHEDWKPIKISLKAEGKPLTDEQMKKVKLSVDFSDDLKYKSEIIPGESAYNVYISQDKNGKYIEPDTGKYKLTASATYINENGKESKSNKDNVSFEIQKYSQLVRKLIVVGIILLILLLLLIIAMILHRIKVFPNNVDADNSIFRKAGKNAGVAAADLRIANKSLFKKTGNISVRASKGNMGISLAIEAIHPLFKWPFKFQKPSRRKYRIVGISASGMDYVKLNGTKYTSNTYSEVNEIAYDQTTVEFEKRISSVKYFVKTDLVNK